MEARESLLKSLSKISNSEFTENLLEKLGLLSKRGDDQWLQFVADIFDNLKSLTIDDKFFELIFHELIADNKSYWIVNKIFRAIGSRLTKIEYLNTALGLLKEKYF